MKRTLEQARTFFQYTERIKNDAYFTKEEDAAWCVRYALENSPEGTRWIEPFAGNGAFLKFMPKGTIGYDINPQSENIIQADSLTLDWENRTALTNIPFNLKKQCIEKALSESSFFWTIAPFSVLKMKNCFVEKAVLFRYGNWKIPRSYLQFQTPGGEKTIYCGFFKITRKEFQTPIIKTGEIWMGGVKNIIEIDNRFYIREKILS